MSAGALCVSMAIDALVLGVLMVWAHEVRHQHLA